MWYTLTIYIYIYIYIYDQHVRIFSRVTLFWINRLNRRSNLVSRSLMVASSVSSLLEAICTSILTSLFRIFRCRLQRAISTLPTSLKICWLVWSDDAAAGINFLINDHPLLLLDLVFFITGIDRNNRIDRKMEIVMALDSLSTLVTINICSWSESTMELKDSMILLSILLNSLRHLAMSFFDFFRKLV